MIYDTFIIIHLSKPIEYKPPRVNPNVNYGLCRIMMWRIDSLIVTNVLGGGGALSGY